MKKSTEISPGLLLHTTDIVGPNRSVVAIEYELEVRKNKLVIFEADFTGSTNLALEGAGSRLSQKTTVEPGKRSLVAVVRVIDPARSWSLETKYTWIEENPGMVQPGQSKREKLADGIILTTSRMSSPDTFSFHLLNEKSVPITVSLDCSKSVNLSMVTIDEPGSTAKKDVSRVYLNQVSISIPAYARAHVCSLVVKDPNSGYQLKTKWSWAENGLRSQSLSEPQSISPQKPWFETSDHGMYDYQNNKRASNLSTPSLALTPQNFSQDLVARMSTEAPYGARPQPRSTPSRPRLKREEISPMVFLETEIIDNLIKPEIVYTIQVAKTTRVTFEADFKGSSNLALVPSGGLACEAVVEPMSKMQVARLRVIDVSMSWKLVCRYKWQEEDIVAPDAIIPFEDQRSSYAPQPVKSIANAPHNPMSEVRNMLRRLNLEAYAELFEAEELTMDLLRVMSRDEAEFRHSLESLGVNKMGHRERILVAVKSLPVNNE